MDDTNVDDSTYVPMRKVLIIGDSGVGKTSIIFSLLRRDISTVSPSIGVANHY